MLVVSILLGNKDVQCDVLLSQTEGLWARFLIRCIRPLLLGYTRKNRHHFMHKLISVHSHLAVYGTLFLRPWSA